MKIGMTAESLRDCLADVPPVELKGMALLRERRSVGQFYPALADIPRETVTEAVTEIIGYTTRCARAAEQLQNLATIVLTAFSVLEYGL